MKKRTQKRKAYTLKHIFECYKRYLYLNELESLITHTLQDVDFNKEISTYHPFIGSLQEFINQYNTTIEIEQTIYYLINIYKIDFDDRISEILSSFIYYKQKFQFLINFFTQDVTKEVITIDENQYPELYSFEKYITESINKEENHSGEFHKKDASNEFFDILKSSLCEKEYRQLKSLTEQIEKERINKLSEIQYKVYQNRYLHSSLKDFYLYLKCVDRNLKNKVKLFNSCEKEYMLGKGIDSRKIVIHYYNLYLLLCERLKDTNNDPTKLTVSIMANIQTEIITQKEVENRIELLKDYISIFNLRKSITPSTLDKKKLKVQIKLEGIDKIEFSSKELTGTIIDNINSFLWKNCLKNIVDIKKELKELEYFNKYFTHILIRKIAIVLIESNIMTYVSSKCNKYNLRNLNNEPIGLRRKDAELIYDILVALGIEIKKSKGKEKNMEILCYDKMDIIKERLETSNIIREDYKVPIINREIMDFTT